jgi:hypothetical protein
VPAILAAGSNTASNLSNLTFATVPALWAAGSNTASNLNLLTSNQSTLTYATVPALWVAGSNTASNLSNLTLTVSNLSTSLTTTTLTALGPATFSNTVALSNSLLVQGATTLSNAATVTGAFTAFGPATFGNVALLGVTSLCNAANVAGTLSVAGTTQTAALTVRENILTLSSAASNNVNQVQFANPNTSTYTIQQIDHGGADYLRIGLNGYGAIVVTPAAAGSGNGSGSVGVGLLPNPSYALDVSGIMNASVGLYVRGMPVGVVVGSIAALRLVSPAATASLLVRVSGYYLPGDGGGGVYYYAAADTSSADDGGATILSADGASRWKLVNDGSVSVCQYGVQGTGADESAMVQAALNWAAARPVVPGPKGTVTAPTNMGITVGHQLYVSAPVRIAFDSVIYSTVASGATFVIGLTAPVNGNNTNYDIRMVGLQSLTGVASPSNVATAGGVGLEIRQMQFSRVRIDTIAGFTQYGVFLNCTNNVYSYQHVQDNDLVFGKVAQCGVGIMAMSVSAETGAVQVNRISVQNLIANYQHMSLGNPNGADYNTNDNDIDIIAMEGVSSTTAGAPGVLLYGLYNRLHITYAGCGVQCAALADANVVVVGNPYVTLSDTSAAASPTNLNNNSMRCGHPNPGTLPAALTVTSGVPVTNGYGVPVVVYLDIVLNAANDRADLYYGRNGGLLAALNSCSCGVAQAGGSTAPMMLLVQPNFVWQVNTGGSASIAAARCMAF